jgi:hypothetical protein
MLKNKNNINVYAKSNNALERRKELSDEILKSDVYLPDSILHDDLDLGMLEYVKKYFIVNSNGSQIPIIPKILTVQKWGEVSTNWTFIDDDNNISLPFISIIRQPDVQPGSNPMLQKTIPDRQTFHYSRIQTWDGTKSGSDIYKIPQPVAIDISYNVTIVTNNIRDLNFLNKIILQKFSSKQSYTIVKGHYIPIVLDSINDNTQFDSIEGRRFYNQTYKFTLLGFLLDSEEFEVKPALSRFMLVTEFIDEKKPTKRNVSTNVDVTSISFIADGIQTSFSVGETIGVLFNVSLNGLTQTRNINYYHIVFTSRITFENAPPEGTIVTILYYKGRNNTILDIYGKILTVGYENFIFDGTMTLMIENYINSVLTLDINGLIESEGVGFEITGSNQITLLGEPVIGSTISVVYFY